MLQLWALTNPPAVFEQAIRFASSRNVIFCASSALCGPNVGSFGADSSPTYRRLLQGRRERAGHRPKSGMCGRRKSERGRGDRPGSSAHAEGAGGGTERRCYGWGRMYAARPAPQPARRHRPVTPLPPAPSLHRPPVPPIHEPVRVQVQPRARPVVHPRRARRRDLRLEHRRFVEAALLPQLQQLVVRNRAP